MKTMILGAMLGLTNIAISAEKEFTAATAKLLIPEAAGMPAEELKMLSMLADVSKFRPRGGDSLTWIALNYQPGKDGPENPSSLRFLEGDPRPDKIAQAITGPKENGKTRKYATLIHPEYISDCTCKSMGDSASGTVTFKADKVYEGKLEYTARKHNGNWRIEEFRLPDLKITIVRDPNGKWVKK